MKQAELIISIRHEIKSIDVSKNTALNFLNLSGCDITSLDLSKNPEMCELSCDAGVNVTGYSGKITPYEP